MAGLRLTKATEKDFDDFRDFLQACENSLESQKFALWPAEEQWQQWEDDDPDKIEILAIRRALARTECLPEKEVDSRIVLYEWLQKKFACAAGASNRIIMAAYVLIDNVCDPTEKYVAFYPGFECFHVAPEQ